MKHDFSNDPTIKALPDHKCHHREDHPSKHVSEDLIGDHFHQAPTHKQADEGRGEEDPQFLPLNMFPVDSNRHEIGGDQHRQNRSRRLLGRHDLCHQDHGNQPATIEASLGETHADRCHGGQEPCECAEMGEG